MVPITTLRVVPIQRYRHIISHYRHMILLVRPTGSPAYSCLRCISFDSYIKPQPKRSLGLNLVVVYLLIPTSNHNFFVKWRFTRGVVYLLIPTSNHNHRHGLEIPSRLYIFWFLHQTTTYVKKYILTAGCISFDSYIKPQPRLSCPHRSPSCISFDSYIKPQLFRK